MSHAARLGRLAWYGPWAWPATPAFAVLDHVIGMDFSELPFAQRAAVLVLLIVVNVATWGAVAYGLHRLVRRRPVDRGERHIEKA